MRYSLIFYRSFYEAIKELPKETQAEVYTAIFEYSLNFKEVELNGLAKTIFTLIRPQLEAYNKRFVNGSKAKTKQDKSETEAKPKQKESESEANNNVNNNANENKSVTSSEAPTKKINDINERIIAFGETLKPFLTKYGKPCVTDFYKYWTEKNKSGTKFRQELEKTWYLNRRLEKWASNERNFLSKKETVVDPRNPKNLPIIY